MKINKVFYLLFIGLLIAGCSSDSDEDNGGNGMPTDPTAGNRLSLGASANDLLSDNNFSTISVEVLVADNVDVSPLALEGLQELLEERTFKTDITFNQRTFPSPNEETYTTDDIRALENDIRTDYNTDTNIAVSIIYIDGRRDTDTGMNVTLGTAYRNTSLVIYKETIDNIARMANTPSEREIEESTLNHEFGHLFGLVNIGSPAQSDHEDEDSRAHCNVDGCLMIASVEFGSGMVGLDNVPELDPLCIEDLQANGGR